MASTMSCSARSLGIRQKGSISGLAMFSPGFGSTEDDVDVIPPPAPVVPTTPLALFSSVSNPFDGCYPLFPHTSDVPTHVSTSGGGTLDSHVVVKATPRNNKHCAVCGNAINSLRKGGHGGRVVTATARWRFFLLTAIFIAEGARLCHQHSDTNIPRDEVNEERLREATISFRELWTVSASSSLRQLLEH